MGISISSRVGLGWFDQTGMEMSHMAGCLRSTDLPIFTIEIDVFLRVFVC